MVISLRLQTKRCKLTSAGSRCLVLMESGNIRRSRIHAGSTGAIVWDCWFGKRCQMHASGRRERKTYFLPNGRKPCGEIITIRALWLGYQSTKAWGFPGLVMNTRDNMLSWNEWCESHADSIRRVQSSITMVGNIPI